MKTCISLKNVQKRSLPEEFRADDVRFTEELVEAFLDEFTKPGDVVFDPFLGFGTTLLVAEKMNRRAFGIEYDRKRWQYVQTLLKYPERAILGDSRRLDDVELPPFDFSITSPPYMGRHHIENPFTAYSTEGDGYEAYLEELKNIYQKIANKLANHGRVVIEVSNLKHDDAPITTLAWDIAGSVSDVMSFEGEVVVNWENGYGFGYDHSYCLVYSKKKKSEPSH